MTTTLSAFDLASSPAPPSPPPPPYIASQYLQQSQPRNLNTWGSRAGPVLTRSLLQRREEHLPSYHSVPTLEPWLAPLRAPDWIHRPLPLFTASHVDDWASTHAALSAELVAWGLSADPFASSNTRAAAAARKPGAYPSPDHAQALRVAGMPEELQGVAMWLTGSAVVAKRVREREDLAVSPLLASALTRLAYFVLARAAAGGFAGCPSPARTLRLLRALPPRLGVPVFRAGLRQDAYDALVRALFVLQCRAQWVRRAEALLRARRGSRVYRMVARALGWPRGQAGKGKEDGVDVEREMSRVGWDEALAHM